MGVAASFPSLFYVLLGDSVLVVAQKTRRSAFFPYLLPTWFSLLPLQDLMQRRSSSSFLHGMPPLNYVAEASWSRKKNLVYFSCLCGKSRPYFQYCTVDHPVPKESQSGDLESVQLVGCWSPEQKQTFTEISVQYSTYVRTFSRQIQG